MPSRVKSVFSVDVLGVHYENEYGAEETRIVFVEPNGAVHILSETVQNTRLFVRAATWLSDGIKEFRANSKKSKRKVKAKQEPKPKEVEERVLSGL